MKLTNATVQSLRPKAKAYSISDGGGLFVEVMSSGRRVWRIRYRLNRKQEKATLGEYPSFSLAEARKWREDCRGLVARGISPAAERKKQKGETTVASLYTQWIEEVVSKRNKNPACIQRMMGKDVLPTLKNRRLSEITVADVQAIVQTIKRRGSDQVALKVRNELKRMFDYAIGTGRLQINPAAQVIPRYIAQTQSREVTLSPEEVRRLLHSIYRSSMRRPNKLAIHLLILTMVRKGELVGACWNEIDLETGEWLVPSKRMKAGREHVVYLSRQAIDILRELKDLALGSDYVLPSRSDLRKCISKSTLNAAIRTLSLDIQDFVIHDFRRTASTLLHENDFHSDWIEKALAHEQRGVRRVYNRAEYKLQRREMMQWWGNFVESIIVGQKNVAFMRFAA